MLDSKFFDPKKNPLLSDVDYINLYMDFKDIFEGVPNGNFISDTEITFLDPSNLTPEAKDLPTFQLQPDLIRVKTLKNNKWNLVVGNDITKFMLLTALRFDSNVLAAQNYVMYQIRKMEIPFIRVGTQYFKIIEKDSRWGGENKEFKKWDKETLITDYGKGFLRYIPCFDDFSIIPNNITYLPTYKNLYNRYAQFPHSPVDCTVTEDDIPNTIILLKHVFQDQWELGLKYFKILYEDPKQILPVLVLVSEERETGKTTFINFLVILFGENAILISPHELTHHFNFGYALRNLILIDEAMLDKNTSIEKLKSLATAKMISVSEKNVNHYSVPFYGKIVLCTNKEKDFMRIDEGEIRFWIRKLKKIEGEKNTNIETDLFNEIPKFLKFLQQLPVVDKSKSRMVFTKEEIMTTELTEVKNESKSSLRKDIEMYIDDYFGNNDNAEYVELTAKDIKEKWYAHNHQTPLSYIRRVIKHEMKIESEGIKKYDPFNTGGEKVTGRPFMFLREKFFMGGNGVGKKEDCPF